ncbi:DUF3817 domain-containing protein [Metabacillus herbersteinensis]|uniref:DUF3817 domain-containing protein n=1 Tax=Metabacillus herbersteinensis TaxID=283816 RepID=A0ABV6GAY4_9BACI
MLKTPVGRLRVVGLLEGISYLLLLFIAMPLKYFFDLPMAVSVVGAAHGFLFVTFVLAAVYVKFAKRWSILWGIWAVIASLIPFGTFILDRQLQSKV